jgi:16S rRNA (cytosine967-C5)-methyltransferase
VTARDVARRVLDRVDHGAWATPALDGELARARLEDRDRRLATELVYGVLRHQLRLDHALSAHADLSRSPPRVRIALRLAAYQILFLRIPGYAAVDDAVDAARAAAGPKVGGFTNAVLRKLVAQGEPPRPPGRAGLAIEHSLPAWIMDELAAAVGDDDAELAAAAAGLAGTPRVAGRVNRRRADRAQVIERLAAEGATAEPAPDAALPDAFWVDGLGDPAASPSFRAGLWTVQDTGAQEVVQLAAPRPATAKPEPPSDVTVASPSAGVAVRRILDACAGVGGKSTYLAELAPDARIDAADSSATKLGLLAETARRLGHADRIHPIACDLRDPKAPLAPEYDLIVLDAPCTGLGVLRRHPEAKYRLTPADVERMAILQRDLLAALAPRLAAGGTLVYAVCSFTRREAEDQLAPLSTFAIDQLRRTWPHKTGADAFFAARLLRQCAI